MREIKFRAWDSAAYDLGGEGMVYFGLESGAIAKDLSVVMQFTGLKDKNGVEIYEGDAFSCMYERDGHTDHWYYVIFNEFSGSFEYQRVGPPCPQNQVSQGVRDGARHGGIGNIHQNPELLTN